MTRHSLASALLAVLWTAPAWAADPKPPAAEPWRIALYKDWKALPEPPICPYTGPFGSEARGFVGKLDLKSGDPAVRAALDNPDKDPRPIDAALETAVLEEWRRMGYNCAYKQGLLSGRFLKKNGLLGYIDQTLWAQNSEPYLTFEGKPGKKAGGDGSGSFLARANYLAGIEKLERYAADHGEADMFKVGNVYITCSWDEIGMRERTSPDYRPESMAEYIAFLRDVWFRDDSPAEDTNQDGRTYNGFTGENLRYWWEVRPPVLSPRFHSSPQPVDELWSRPAACKLWLDYHRYFTFEYFRRASADASARLAAAAYAREYRNALAAGQPVNTGALRKKTDLRVDCYPFPQAFLIWPGIDAFWGYGVYWNHRQNAVINVEQCWPEHPAMSVNYAMTDHLARTNKNLIMGWSWFFPRQYGCGALYDGPGDIERALARMMGHTVDGITHWLYADEYRGPGEGPLRQRRQLAYWHNFLRRHYTTFLSRSSPVRPEVALLIPDYTGYFYGMYQYPKSDYAWTAVALGAAQIPFAVITEEEIELEPDALKPFKAVYVIGSEWSTPTLRQKFADYVAAGGTLCANVDSLSLDIGAGKRTDFLETVCGVRLSHKYKSPFQPSAQTAEERAWAARIALPPFQADNVHTNESRLWKNENGNWVADEEAWSKLNNSLTGMPATARGGIPQSVLDMRAPPAIRYGEQDAAPVTSYGEICTADVLKGKPIAWYGDKVCGVETERTVWLGDRPGASLHALFPRLDLSRATEPVNPFVTGVTDDYEKFRPYVQILTRAANKAGVQRLVTLTRDGVMPMNLEVLPRTDADGTLMVVVVNHDSTDAAYEVAIDPAHLKKPLLKNAEAWDMLRETVIEPATDGVFTFKVEPWRAGVFMVGSSNALARVKETQARLNKMDLSVPPYFAERRKTP
jgi:hypothetical protein